MSAYIKFKVELTHFKIQQSALNCPKLHCFLQSFLPEDFGQSKI